MNMNYGRITTLNRKGGTSKAKSAFRIASKIWEIAENANSVDRYRVQSLTIPTLERDCNNQNSLHASVNKPPSVSIADSTASERWPRPISPTINCSYGQTRKLIQRLMKCVFLSIIMSLTLIGCVSSPSLQGGDIYFENSNSEEDSVALAQLSKVDLIYELDPKKKGFCHKGEHIKNINDTIRLRCALDGFNSYEYFDELPSDQKEKLKVNNVTVAYVEKQVDRLTKLAKQFDEAIATGKASFYEQFATDVQTQIIDIQKTNTINKLKFANENSAYFEYQRNRRNEVQSSILIASDAACDLYKRRLNGLYSDSNFGFGSFATAMGGLGAIVTGADEARALAGIAGVTSGVRAEWNDAYFRNQVVEVLTKAMDIARKKKREEIQRRSVQVTSDYNIQQSINDAIDYNSKCTLIAGLQETSEALQVVSDPGLKWLASAFGGAASNRELTSKLFESLGGAVSEIQQIQKTTEDPNAVSESADPDTNTDSLP